MSKSVSRTPESQGKSDTSPESAECLSDKPTLSDATPGRRLLDHILNIPGLEQVVPRLQPDLIHRVIEKFGLEDCGELVALATPEQLAQIFDLDLWRPTQPGMNEQFDPNRFGLWIEVLAEYGAQVAAQKLAGIDVDLIVTGLSRHVLVYDRAAVTPYRTLDGETIETYCVEGDGLTCDIGSYLLVARRADSWDAIIGVLLALGEGDLPYFRRLMAGCRRLSSSGRELDGLDDLLADEEQKMFDVAVDREGRRENQGYVTPAQARAFLQMARELRVASEVMPPQEARSNPLVRAYFRGLNENMENKPDARPDTQTEVEPDANLTGASSFLASGLRAGSGSEERSCSTDQTETISETCFGGSSIKEETGKRGDRGEDPQGEGEGISAEIAQGVAAVVDLLRGAGIAGQPPRALLGASEGQSSGLRLIRAQMRFALEHSEEAYSARSEELGFLANTLMAGCSIQGRSFTTQEASDAALAVTNLGLENWPRHWLGPNATSLPASFLVDHDLVNMFQVGWKVLYDGVVIYATEKLLEVLTQIRLNDSELQSWLDALSMRLAKDWRAGAPWRARDELEVIAMLDTPAWAVLLGLIDECPALHPFAHRSKSSASHSVNTFDFDFISENGQIESIREFMRLLPEKLGS